MFNLKPKLEAGMSKNELLRGCQRAVRLYDTLIAELQAKPVPDQAVNYVISNQRQEVIEFMFKLDNELNGKHQNSTKENPRGQHLTRNSLKP